VQLAPRGDLPVAEQDEPRGRDPSGTIGRNIEPFLLLELVRQSSYGYDLIRRLADYGFRRATDEPGVVYKVLRSLEDQGCILSTWSTQESGPARRYYEITPGGQELLQRRIGQLRRTQDRIDRLLREYAQLDGEASEAVDDLGEREPAISGVGGL
jgi:PadR family transcriptional regulator PadR